MFKVTAVSFHAEMQTFSPLISSVFDNGVLHTTGPRSDQMRVRYMNK